MSSSPRRMNGSLLPRRIPDKKRNEEDHLNQLKLRLETLVHDLKNPLSIGITNLNMLRENQDKFGPLTPKQVSLVERVIRSIQSCQGIVENILELGKSSAGIDNQVEFKIRELVVESVFAVADFEFNHAYKHKDQIPYDMFVSTAKSHHFMVDVSKQLWSEKFKLDFAKLKQILRNLLSNALKFKNETISLKVNKEADCLIITVKDDGPGIPPVYHDQIFDSYFQIDQPFETYIRGHGLGLAAVAVLVKDLKGRVTIKSSRKNGAEFRVQIPLYTPA